jgi:hypothetical protein
LLSNGENIENLIEFNYKSPSYGFEGFDKEAFNERLNELLNDYLGQNESF